jgi:tetratricopeptide (TPR) repeat protein
MTTKSQESYLNDPKFQSAMEHLQRGEWEAGLAGIENIQKEYPYVKELEQIRQETLIKTRFDEYEIEDKKQARARNTLKVVLRIAAVVLVIAGIFYSITLFDTWIVDQWTNITESLQGEIRTIETAIRFRDAQSYLQSNFPDQALEILSEMQAAGEDYPGMEELIAEAEEMKGVKADYEAAVELLENGNSLAALDAFQEIYAVRPNYLDVGLKIQDIQSEFYLLELLDEAENAYENEDWKTAASEYETLRAIAPEYKPELVETRLIRSYMNIAAEILENETESPDALNAADTYFRKALVLRPRNEDLLAEQAEVTERFKERLFQHYVEAAKEVITGQEDSLSALNTATDYFNNALLLRPNNAEVKRELNLATAYLQAQIDYGEGLVNQAIENLEYVYDVNPFYANGTALQTLYESYMERGDARSATGQLEAALDDYQRSAELAVQASNPVLKLYMAKVNIAEVQGTLNQYTVAVNNYKDAVEIINLLPILEAEDQNRAFLLKEATRYADIEWYRTAYRLYRRVLPASDLIFDIEEVVIIKEGDYLSRLANIYGTTVQEILDANAIPNPGSIQLGQEIKIPVLKESD